MASTREPRSYSLANLPPTGTPAHILPPQDDPSIFVPDIRPTSLRKNQAAEQHVRKKIQELVSTVDSGVKVDADAEDVSDLSTTSTGR